MRTAGWVLALIQLAWAAGPRCDKGDVQPTLKGAGKCSTWRPTLGIMNETPEDPVPAVRTAERTSSGSARKRDHNRSSHHVASRKPASPGTSPRDRIIHPKKRGPGAARSNLVPLDLPEDIESLGNGYEGDNEPSASPESLVDQYTGNQDQDAALAEELKAELNITN